MILVPGSLGDIIALSEIIIKILEALDETRGAPAEMQEVAGYIEEFRVLLQAVCAQLSKAPDVAATRTLIPLIRRQINASASILGDLWGIISPYNSVKASGTRIDAIFKLPYHKLKWSFKNKAKAVAMKEKLSDHHMKIQTYLIQIMIIPQTLSYTSENALVMKDFTDIRITVPWALCQTWQDFMSFLTSHYRNSTGPAASFFEAGDFTVLDPLNSSIDASNWNLIQERSYHVTLAINVAAIQAIPGGGKFTYFRGLVECNVAAGNFTLICDPNSLAQWRGRRRSRRAVESSQIKNIHLVPTKRLMAPIEDYDATNMCQFSNVIWVCEDAKYHRCSFSGCLLATTDCQFVEDEMTGVRLLQNTRNSFRRVHFINCVFLNVIDNQFKECLFSDCTFHSFSDAVFTECNTFVNECFSNPALFLYDTNDPNFLEQLRRDSDEFHYG